MQALRFQNALQGSLYLVNILHEFYWRYYINIVSDSVHCQRYFTQYSHLRVNIHTTFLVFMLEVTVGFKQELFEYLSNNANTD
jgi:hypothetical protein